MAELHITRTFHVEPDIIFDAFTKPDAMRIWWTDDTEFDMDLKVGGTWTITRKEGDTLYTMTGEYIEINRPYHLKHTISMPQFSPNSDLITITIKPLSDGKSRMTFIQSGPDIAAELAGTAGEEPSESEKGWQMGFDLMEDAWKK